MVSKETFMRTKANNELEEQQDLKLQSYAKHLDDVYNAAMGTDANGVENYGWGTDAWGTVKEGATDFAKSFTGGDVLSLAGNLYSGIAPLLSAKGNAATDTPNENLYKGFGDEALQSLDQAGEQIAGQKTIAENKINLNATSATNTVRNQSRGINQVKAGELGVFSKTNQAMDNLYGTFSKMMMDKYYKESALKSKIGQVEAQGATAADIANRKDKDVTDSAIAAAQGNLGTAIQQTGKDLNASKLNTILTNLSGSLFKYGLKFENGEIVKADE
jgi:hypothetical protein